MNIQEILNTIYDNASDMYRERVPEATKNNIQEIQEVMSDPNNAVVANEFMSTLLNMIISRSIYVAGNGIIPFFFIVKQNSIIYTLPSLSIHLSWIFRFLPCLVHCN